MSEREAANYMIRICTDAYNKWTTAGYDLIQYLQQGIEKWSMPYGFGCYELYISISRFFFSFYLVVERREQGKSSYFFMGSITTTSVDVRAFFFVDRIEKHKRSASYVWWVSSICKNIGISSILSVIRFEAFIQFEFIN